MKELEANMKIQSLALDYLEKHYGKDWRKKETLNSTAIFNAFVSGYKEKEQDDKTAHKLVYPRKLVDKIEPRRETIEKIFGLKVIVKDDMPDNLIAFTDENMNVLTFIELLNKG